MTQATVYLKPRHPVEDGGIAGYVMGTVVRDHKPVAVVLRGHPTDDFTVYVLTSAIERVREKK